MEITVTYVSPIFIGLLCGEVAILRSVVGFVMAELLFDGEIPRRREAVAISILVLSIALVVSSLFLAFHLGGLPALFEWLCCVLALLYSVMPFPKGYRGTLEKVLTIATYVILHACMFVSA